MARVSELQVWLGVAIVVGAGVYRLVRSFHKSPCVHCGALDISPGDKGEPLRRAPRSMWTSRSRALVRCSACRGWAVVPSPVADRVRAGSWLGVAVLAALAWGPWPGAWGYGWRVWLGLLSGVGIVLWRQQRWIDAQMIALQGPAGPDGTPTGERPVLRKDPRDVQSLSAMLTIPGVMSLITWVVTFLDDDPLHLALPAGLAMLCAALRGFRKRHLHRVGVDTVSINAWLLAGAFVFGVWLGMARGDEDDVPMVVSALAFALPALGIWAFATLPAVQRKGKRRPGA